MNLDRVGPGRDLPDEFNVIIEIPMNADPIKYEVDKETGALFVDRLMSTAMHYPCNYGYIPRTLSGDGDPVDVLLLSPLPLISGVVVRCRAIGMLKMTDEAGSGEKLLAVPIAKLCNDYHRHVRCLEHPVGRGVFQLASQRILSRRANHDPFAAQPPRGLRNQRRLVAHLEMFRIGHAVIFEQALDRPQCPLTLHAMIFSAVVPAHEVGD